MKRKLGNGSSSDEDIPLMLLSKPKRLMKHHNLSSNMKILFEHKEQKCEICDKLLYNTYDLMVHSAKHIIIPLTREMLPQCQKCHKYYATAVDLKVHEEVEHFEVPDILINFVKSDPVVQCENTVTDLIIEHNETKLEQILRKEAVVKCDSVIKDFIAEKSSEVLKPFVNKMPVISCVDTISNLLKPEHVKSNSMTNNDLSNLRNDAEHNSQGLITEDVTLSKLPKADDVILISDDSNDCKPETDCNKSDFILPDDNYTDLITPDDLNLNIKVSSTREPIDLNFNDDRILPESFNLNLYGDKHNGIEPKTSKPDVISEAKNAVLKDLRVDVPSQVDNNRKQIKSKILFEDDVVKNNDEMVTKALSHLAKTLAVPKVPKKLFVKKFIPNKIIIGTKLCTDDSGTADDNDRPKSVHYYELIRSEIQECNLCGAALPNKYDLIIHKTNHHLDIITKPNPDGRVLQLCRYCEKYICGNYSQLEKHCERAHGKCFVHKKLKECPHCEFKYCQYFRHLYIYHGVRICPFCRVLLIYDTAAMYGSEEYLDIHTCEKYLEFLKKKKPFDINVSAKKNVNVKSVLRFESDDKNNTVQSESESERELSNRIVLLNFCNICALLLRNSVHFSYSYMGTINALPHIPGDFNERKLLRCAKCSKEFEELKVYKRIRQLLGIKTYKKPVSNVKGPLSNVKRLENIQKRLKNMKKYA